MDECFLPLSEYQHSLASLAATGSKLFVVKAFTKTFAIPGIRIGYVISSAENISRLEGYIPEWSLSIPAVEAGIACANIMVRRDFLKRSYIMVRKERDYLEKSLSDLEIEVIPSDTAYILFHTRPDLYEKLLDRGILIRDCSDFKGLNMGWFRIAVKDHTANQSIVNAIKEIKLTD